MQLPLGINMMIAVRGQDDGFSQEMLTVERNGTCGWVGAMWCVGSTSSFDESCMRTRSRIPDAESASSVEATPQW